MAKKKEDGAGEASPENLKIKFKKLAAGAYGVFPAGSVQELPGELALSFIAEDVAEEA